MRALTIRSILRSAARAPVLIRAGIVAMFATLAAAIPLRAETTAEVQRLADEAIRRLDLQAELPRAAETWSIRLPSGLGLILLLAAAAVLVFLFLAYARGDLLSVWRKSQSMADEAPKGGEVRPRPAEEVMTAADELARQGRFVEAMHTLLLQSLAEIRQRLDERFADSLTSREILRRARLSEPGRASLREIIARVEWTYFGEHPAGAADYQACRERFSELAEALRSGALA